MMTFSEKGVSVKVPGFLCGIPNMATVSLEGGRLRCYLTLFGLKLRTLLDQRVEDLSEIRISCIQGFAWVDIFDKRGQLVLGFEPQNTRQWCATLSSAGLSVPDSSTPSLNRAANVALRMFTWVVLTFLLGVLLIVAYAVAKLKLS